MFVLGISQKDPVPLQLTYIYPIEELPRQQGHKDLPC